MRGNETALQQSNMTLDEEHLQKVTGGLKGWEYAWLAVSPLTYFVVSIGYNVNRC